MLSDYGTPRSPIVIGQSRLLKVSRHVDRSNRLRASYKARRLRYHGSEPAFWHHQPRSPERNGHALVTQHANAARQALGASRSSQVDRHRYVSTRQLYGHVWSGWQAESVGCEKVGSRQRMVHTDTGYIAILQSERSPRRWMGQAC